MMLTPAQLKGRIKSIEEKNNADVRLLMRIYMMDCFLERLVVSPYRDNFIIKGGILVTSMVGVAMRSTMDIDASIKNLTLSIEDSNANDTTRLVIKEGKQIIEDPTAPKYSDITSLKAALDK